MNNLKIGDTVLLKEHPGEWEISMVLPDRLHKEYDFQYTARSVPNTGFPDSRLVPIVKLKDEHIEGRV